MDEVRLSRIRQEAYEQGYQDGKVDGYNLAGTRMSSAKQDRKEGHGRLIDADAFAAEIIKIIESRNYDDFYAKSLSVGAILREVVSELNGTSLQGFANAPTIIEAEEGTTK